MKNNINVGVIILAVLFFSCNNSKKKEETSKADSVRSTKSIDVNLPSNPINLSESKQLETLNVAPNASFTLDADVRTYSVMKLGDNSKIIISPNLKKCKLTALRSFIGNNVKIIASGMEGSVGQSGFSMPDNNNHGRDGAQGGSGSIGGRGGDGITLEIFLGFDKLEKLEIISQGGKGGAGGTGGKGQRGGNARRFVNSGGNGGAGGFGGSGGQGGNGGTVRLVYWYNDDPTNVGGSYDINVPPGEGGDGGAGGPGGGGGTPHGNRSGGNPGPSGNSGNKGQVGAARGTADYLQVKRPG